MIFDPKKGEIIGKAVREWSRLKKIVEKQCGGNDWIFRAMGAWKGKDPPIKSHFDEAWERTRPKRKRNKRNWNERRLYEARMLYEFKREAHHYLTHLPEKDDFLEWMALARHYEMPTRLVDFTYSFYVAAYFALSLRKDDEDGCIVAFNWTRMKKAWERKLKQNRYRWLRETGIARSEATFHNPALFWRFAFEKRENYVVPVNPLRRNPRLAKQQGLFLCPGNIAVTFEENLQETLDSLPYPKSRKRLICLKADLRSDAINDLTRMNVNMATLYPELTGWAQSCRDLVHRPITDERFKQELENAIKHPWI